MNDRMTLEGRAETVASDLKTCNDSTGMGYQGREQFARCMGNRGYIVRLP